MAKGIKTGGRSVGTPNKVTSDIRTSINDFLNNNINTLQENFDKLEPKDKIYFIERLLKYSIPRMNDSSFMFNSNANRGFYFDIERD
jgi:hypothetical protein